MVPIPGTRRVKYLMENLGAADVTLSADEMTTLEEVVSAQGCIGDRYSEDMMAITFKYGEKA